MFDSPVETIPMLSSPSSFERTNYHLSHSKSLIIRPVPDADFLQHGVERLLPASVQFFPAQTAYSGSNLVSNSTITQLLRIREPSVLDLRELTSCLALLSFISASRLFSFLYSWLVSSLFVYLRVSSSAALFSRAAGQPHTSSSPGLPFPWLND